jgi:hypothetical protein
MKWGNWKKVKIYPIQLAGGTTPFAQVLDCMGVFRALKSNLRVHGFANECAMATVPFWQIYLATITQGRFVSAIPFLRCGFSRYAWMMRMTGRAAQVPLWSRLAKLRAEALPAIG